MAASVPATATLPASLPAATAQCMMPVTLARSNTCESQEFLCTLLSTPSRPNLVLTPLSMAVAVPALSATW